MLIPESIWRNLVQDVDTAALFQVFDHPLGAKVLDVGCHDESSAAAKLLAQQGYEVHGVDLRQSEIGIEGIQYLQADICDLPKEYLCQHLGTFDAVTCISALEHFGLGAYGEGAFHEYYDVLASRVVWSLLKEGGTFYLTVPFGRRFLEIIPHWRVYDIPAIMKRLVQDFTIRGRAYFFSSEAPTPDMKRMYQPGEQLAEAEAMLYPGTPPHLTTLFILEKVSHPRLAPEGR